MGGNANPRLPPAASRRTDHVRPPPARFRSTDPACRPDRRRPQGGRGIRSEEHTSELQSLMRISYAVFCLQKTTNYQTQQQHSQDQQSLQNTSTTHYTTYHKTQYINK